MTSTTVTNTAALVAAVQSAQPGDVVLLAAGAYSGVAISNVAAGGVTIASADPLNKAVLTSLNVTGSSGLTFDGLEYSFPESAAAGINVTTSQDVHFRNSYIHGTLNNDPTNDATGMKIAWSTNVSAEYNEFNQLRNGIIESNSDFITFIGNNFHDLRSDGIDNNASSHVLIQGNNFSRFHYVSGDHSDAIQFYTTGQTVGVDDIKVLDNVIVQNAQGRRMQGVFIHNEAHQTYTNVEVGGNLIVGGHWNGIWVYDADGVNVHDNVLVPLKGQEPPFLRLFYTDNATVTNNSTRFLDTATANTNLTTTGNTVNVADVIDWGLQATSQWFNLHPGRVVAGGPKSPTQLVGAEAYTVYSSTSYHMGEMSHYLYLTGTAAIDGVGNDVGDNIFGNAASNRIWGGAGVDKINGGGGADFIWGLGGNDWLTGGAGVDTFYFAPGSGDDAITDFGVNGDKDVIDISGYLAKGMRPSVIVSGTSDTLISFSNGDWIKLVGVAPAELTATSKGYIHI